VGNGGKELVLEAAILLGSHPQRALLFVKLEGLDRCLAKGAKAAAKR